jgi:transcriptional regulator with XRE-family HTH domain
MSGLPQRFGAAVRHHREAKRWSQEILADRAQLNRSYLGEVERGNVVPSLSTMDKLARALELRLSWLLTACEGAPPE